MSLAKTNRKLHRIGALLVAAPFLLVILTGLLLQLKKDWDWVQPPTQRGSTTELELSFDQILAAAREATGAGIRGWEDVDRLDVRPDKGMVKVRGVHGVEVQLDAATGEILQVAERRSDWIEDLHDGSWFGDAVKTWIFLPVAVVVLGLWITGAYLWWLPHGTRRRKRRAG